MCKHITWSKFTLIFIWKRKKNITFNGISLWFKKWSHLVSCFSSFSQIHASTPPLVVCWGTRQHLLIKLINSFYLTSRLNDVLASLISNIGRQKKMLVMRENAWTINREGIYITCNLAVTTAKSVITMTLGVQTHSIGAYRPVGFLTVVCERNPKKN
jgi:hypothetical protein